MDNYFGYIENDIRHMTLNELKETIYPVFAHSGFGDAYRIRLLLPTIIEQQRNKRTVYVFTKHPSVFRRYSKDVIIMDNDQKCSLIQNDILTRIADPQCMVGHICTWHETGMEYFKHLYIYNDIWNSLLLIYEVMLEN